MKVICIDDKMKNRDLFPLVVGNEYTITGNSKVWPGYYLAEHPFDRYGNKCSYAYKHFAPKSSIDETEFERIYNKELV